MGSQPPIEPKAKTEPEPTQGRKNGTWPYDGPDDRFPRKKLTPKRLAVLLDVEQGRKNAGTWPYDDRGRALMVGADLRAAKWLFAHGFVRWDGTSRFWAIPRSAQSGTRGREAQKAGVAIVHPRTRQPLAPKPVDVGKPSPKVAAKVGLRKPKRHAVEGLVLVMDRTGRISQPGWWRAFVDAYLGEEAG